MYKITYREMRGRESKNVWYWKYRMLIKNIKLKLHFP